jgi:CheY-like chemotaxis protein
MSAMEKTVHILLAEDDQIDQKAFLRAFDKLRIKNPVTVAKDGLEAWEILKGSNGKPPLGRPNLLILDINMPRMNGLELLERIREDADLHDSIVFMLTTSNDEEDKIEAFNLNVAGYMLKSDIGQSFVKAVELVDNYWRVMEFPSGSSGGTSGRMPVGAVSRSTAISADSRGML